MSASVFLSLIWNELGIELAGVADDQRLVARELLLELLVGLGLGDEGDAAHLVSPVSSWRIWLISAGVAGPLRVHCGLTLAVVHRYTESWTLPCQ